MAAVIFDLNGTLVNSEHAHWMAYRDVLSGYGIDFGFEEFSEDWTRRGYGLDFTLGKHGCAHLQSLTDKLKQEKDRVFRENLTQRIVLMHGAAEALNSLAPTFDLAVDSTSSLEDVVRILRLVQIDSFFTMITSGDMPWDGEQYGMNDKLSRFRYVADSLQLHPRQCLVVGDAEKDVRAAKGVGMAVIIVPTETTKHNDFSSADLMLPSLAGLTPEVVWRLLRN